ncbi:uncharacterized protein [Watersipora subatra]|uniref:uncharacterized protein n=1 Tax=Watersipora subatra TaxID=2589382 RepID=UPI00355B586E
MAYNNSLEWIKSKRLCYSCVLEGHSTSDFKNKTSCKKCKKPHSTILHKTKKDWDATKRETKQKETQSSNTEKPSTIKNAVQEDKPNSKREATQVDVKNTKSKARTLSMVMPVFVSAENSQEKTLTYALLDSQSDTCFISLWGTNSQSNLHSLVTRTKKDQEIIQLIERDFKDCEEERMSQEDLKFLATLQKGTFQNKNGNYVLPLPFKKEEIEFPLNRPQAERKLAQLLKRLKTDKNYQQEYNKFMNKLLTSGHTEVPANDCSRPGTVWYIPHFGFMHLNKKTKKIRVMFDASTKYEGISLNDVLLQGPDLMNSLEEILLI